jgi:hypothetical protein
MQGMGWVSGAGGKMAEYASTPVRTMSRIMLILLYEERAEGGTVIFLKLF